MHVVNDVGGCHRTSLTLVGQERQWVVVGVVIVVVVDYVVFLVVLCKKA